jgi:hypothetical protein
MAGNWNCTSEPEGVSLERAAKERARTGTVLNSVNARRRTPGETDRMLRRLQSWDGN